MDVCPYAGSQATTEWSLTGWGKSREIFPAVVDGCCNYINVTYFGEAAGTVDLRCREETYGSSASSIFREGSQKMCVYGNPMSLAQHGWRFGTGHDDLVKGFHRIVKCDPLPPPPPPPTTTTLGPAVPWTEPKKLYFGTTKPIFTNLTYSDTYKFKKKACFKGFEGLCHYVKALSAGELASSSAYLDGGCGIFIHVGGEARNCFSRDLCIRYQPKDLVNKYKLPKTPTIKIEGNATLVLEHEYLDCDKIPERSSSASSVKPSWQTIAAVAAFVASWSFS